MAQRPRADHPLIFEHLAVMAQIADGRQSLTRERERAESTEKHLARLVLEIDLIEKKYGPIADAVNGPLSEDEEAKAAQHPLRQRLLGLYRERRRVTDHLAEYRANVESLTQILSSHSAHLALFEETYGKPDEYEPEAPPAPTPPSPMSPPPIDDKTPRDAKGNIDQKKRLAGKALAMAQQEADVVLSWFSSGSVAKSAFSRPTVMIQLPTPDGRKYKAQIASFGQQPIRSIVQQYAPKIRPLRIAVLGFSEGCQGAREMLASPDGGRIDAAVAIDGIHAQFQPGSQRKIVPAYLTTWAAFAARATQGRTAMIVSASDVRPDGFCSTTESSNWIWRQATGSDQDQQTSPIPLSMVAPLQPAVVYAAGQDKSGVKWPKVTYATPPLDRFRSYHGLYMAHYADKDPTGHNDHIFQGQHVLPELLTDFLAERWNTIAPEAGICTLSGPEFSDPERIYSFAHPSPTLGDVPPDLAPGCFPPAKLTDAYMAGNADPKPLDIPDPSEVDPTLPGDAPPAPEPDSTLVTVLKWTALTVAGGILAEGARRIFFKPRRR